MDEKNFRAWITPLTGKASEGKWDWRVTVQRLTDGMTTTEKVSGGWPVAEAYAEFLARKLNPEN